MKVVAFNGSPRPKGNTSILLSTALAELEKEGIETEMVQVGGRNVRGCIACFKCAQNQDRRCAVDTDIVNECAAKMYEADGVILGSPVYFADVAADLKAMMERIGMVSLVNGYLLKRKLGAGVVAVRRAGGVHTFDSINHFFLIEQMIIPGSSYWNVAVGREPGEVQGDEEGMRIMRDLGANMAWLLKKIHG
jgi:multimeric flavodoxin WrbA